MRLTADPYPRFIAGALVNAWGFRVVPDTSVSSRDELQRVCAVRIPSGGICQSLIGHDASDPARGGGVSSCVGPEVNRSDSVIIITSVQIPRKLELPLIVQALDRLCFCFSLARGRQKQA